MSRSFMHIPGALPAILALSLTVGGGLSRAQVNLLTANGGNDRTNANLLETVLNPATVTPATFGKTGSLAVDGQVYAQVLYVSALPIPGLGVHDVAIACTMHNSVYAFDATPGTRGRILWQVNLGQSVPSSIDIQPEIGILSTGVIDLPNRLLYVVAETLENSVPTFSLHALDLTSGAERVNGPVTITAAVKGTGVDAGVDQTVSLNPNLLLQRPGLLLANGSVYVAFGSHADISPWHGWIVSYDASDLTNQTGGFNTTPNGDGGAVWQSGRGLAADESGNIYAISGNGDYDGLQNFGETFLKLPGSLSTPSDWFTPLDWQIFTDVDADLSAGPALITGTNTLIGADKAGNLYAIDTRSMGGMGAGNTFTVGTGYIFNFAVWNQPGGMTVYVQPSAGPLESYQIQDDQITALSSVDVPNNTARLGMTISANGTDPTTGILWEFTEGASGAGTLHAFNASDLSVELWNSDMNSGRDTLGNFPKFVSPTVVNGIVYAPTFSNTIAVYGMLSSGRGEVMISNRCAPLGGLTSRNGGAVMESDPDGRCAPGARGNSYLK